MVRTKKLSYVIVFLLLMNNLGPYFGYSKEFSQTMFSGLNTLSGQGNHLFMPLFLFSDIGDYYSIESVAISPVTAESLEQQTLRRFLSQAVQSKYVFNSEVVKSSIRRLCQGGANVGISFKKSSGPQLKLDNACLSADYSSENRWIPVRLYVPELTKPRAYAGFE